MFYVGKREKDWISEQFELACCATDMSSEASSAENTNGVVKKPSAIVSKETLVSTRWLSLSTLTYTDPLGVARVRTFWISFLSLFVNVGI